MSSTLLVSIAFVLFVLVIFQLARTTEYVAHLRGEEKAQEDADRINGRLFLAFLIIGLSAMFWSIYHYMPYMILNSASVHGQWLDSMFNITLFFTGIVFIATQVMPLLFCLEVQAYEGPQGSLFSRRQPPRNVVDYNSCHRSYRIGHHRNLSLVSNNRS